MHFKLARSRNHDVVNHVCAVWSRLTKQEVIEVEAGTRSRAIHPKLVARTPTCDRNSGEGKSKQPGESAGQRRGDGMHFSGGGTGWEAELFRKSRRSHGRGAPTGVVLWYVSPRPRCPQSSP